MNREQAFADLAFNPPNVPRTVPSRLHRFMPLAPITSKQQHLLNDLIAHNGIGAESLRLMFGEGFVSVDRLSSWAASWAIGEIQEFESRRFDDEALASEAEMEQVMKAVIADLYLTNYPNLRQVSVDD